MLQNGGFEPSSYAFHTKGHTQWKKRVTSQEMNPDTPENRIYIQRNRLWLLGEVIVMKLMKERPADPIAAAVAVLESEKAKPTESIEPPTPEDAFKAKEYLQENKIAQLIEGWYKETLESKPEHPLDYSLNYFVKLQGGAAASGSGAGAAAAGKTEQQDTAAEEATLADAL